MAKPRVFVSSTYYDLKHVRASLETFISELGYEAILFESGDIPFHHDKPLDQNCYDAIANAHIFVLLIGGRYGSSASATGTLPNESIKQQEAELDSRFKFYNSVTSEEYRRARARDIPIYIFLEKGVAAEYQTYKENRDIKIKWAHVDHVGVFRLLDDIFAQSRNNLVKEFESFENISSWLRDQWAGLMADFLAKKTTDSAIGDLSTQMENLHQVVEALKSYSEAIVKKVEPTKSAGLINQVEKKMASDIVSSNPLIRFLGPKIAGDPDRVINALAKATSILEFCNLLEVSEETTTDVITHVSRHAARDLNAMRSRLGELSILEDKFKNLPLISEISPDLDSFSPKNAEIAKKFSIEKSKLIKNKNLDTIESGLSTKLAELESIKEANELANKKIAEAKKEIAELMEGARVRASKITSLAKSTMKAPTVKKLGVKKRAPTIKKS